MTQRPRYPRSNCCVPFCRRTSTLFSDDWLCGDHWRLIPRRLRQAWFRALRQIRRTWDAAPYYRKRRMYERQERLWRRLKREAITRAAGAPL